MEWLYSKRCEPRSTCAHQARQLLKVLTMHIEPPGWFGHSSKWAQQQWHLLPSASRTQIINDTLDDSEHHMLTRHKCPSLALETVREASLMLYATSNSFAYSDGKNCSSDTQHLWLRVITSILRLPPYTVSAEMADTLAWALPKHKGHGIQSLKALHDIRSTM